MLKRAMRIMTAVATVVGSGVPARAADFALDDIVMATSAAVYRAKRVEISGTTLSREDAQKLLAADNPASGAERLTRLDAAKIVIPELVSESKAQGYSQSVVYRDVVIQRVVHGVAETLDAAGASLASERGASTTRGSIGAMHGEGVDFPAAIELTNGARKSADEPKRRTNALFTIADLKMDLPDGVQVAFGRLAGKDIGGRAMATPVTSLIELAPKPGDGPASPETSRALAAMTRDMLESFDIGSIEMNDIATSKAVGEGKPAADAPGSMKIRRVAIDGMRDGKIAGFAIDALEGAADKNVFRVDRIALSGLDLRPVFAAAADPASANGRASPRFDRLEIAGVSATPEGGPVSLERAAIDARDWYAGLPASVAVRIDHAIVLLTGAAAARNPTLALLGYDRTDISAALDTKYDAAKSAYSIDKLSVDGKDMAGARLSAQMTHVSPDLFGGNSDKLRAALGSITFWSATLHLDDHGLIGRYADAQARTSGRSVAAVREEFANGGRAMAKTLSAQQDPRLDRLAEAIASFLQGAKSLDVGLSMSSGMSAIEFVLASQKGALPETLKIDARAQ